MVKKIESDSKRIDLDSYWMIEEEAREYIPSLLYKYWQYIIQNDFDFGQAGMSADFFKPKHVFLKTWGLMGTEKHDIPDHPQQRYVKANLTSKIILPSRQDIYDLLRFVYYLLHLYSTSHFIRINHYLKNVF